MLETRVMPVIGAGALASMADPGTNLDGVVSLQSVAGLGSGAELADQRMILTAAHVLGYVGQPLVNQTVTFNLQRDGAAVNIAIPVAGAPQNTILPTVANAGAGMAWTTTGPNGSVANDIGLVVLRDPNALPGVPAGNLQMVAPFSPFENGYDIFPVPGRPGAPAINVTGQNGPEYTMVGYGDTGIGQFGTITQSGIQQ